MDTTRRPSAQLHLLKKNDVNEFLQEKITQRRGSLPVDEAAELEFLSPARARVFSVADSRPGEWIKRQNGNAVLSDGPSVSEAEEPDSPEKVTRGFSYEDPSFFDDIEVEDTCLVALATAYNARETEGGTTKQQLLHFVEECFKLPSEKLEQLKKKAQTTDKPELYLLCKVLRASGLTAKDANGLSDPYCRLGILNEEHQEKHIVKHKDLEDWQRDRLVESIASTTVKPATLEPEWNEEVHLSVAKPTKEILVLEVWDSDEPSETNGDKIKGLRGLGTFIAEKTINRGDDFMGRLFYPLRSIPNSGEEKTFVIHSHSGKTQHGYVTLQLSIGAKKKKTPLQKRLAEYTALTRALVNFSARKEGNYERRWSGKLPPKAEKLLEFHAVLNDVDALQQACVRLSVLVKYHKLYAVNMKAICDLIRKIKEYRVMLSSTTAQDEWKKQLFVDLNELSEEIQGVLMNHLSMFNIKSMPDVTKIEERVKTLSELFSFGAFTEQLPPGNDSLKGTLEKCVSVAVPNWFLVLNAQLLPQVNNEAELLETFKGLSEHCLHQCQRAFKYLNPIFLEAGVDYFSFFFVSLDKLLCEEAESRLRKFSESTDPSTFEIYLSFKGISKMAKYVNKNMSKNLSVPHFHKWFKDMVRNWIRIATDKCKDYTAKAIAADSEITVTDEVMFSTSAVDTTGFLLQVGSFWKHLEWPVASEAYGFAVSVMQKISECSLFYVGEVFRKLNHDDMFDEKGRFRATEKLCIVLNNMQHIRQEITQFEEKLELQSFYDWLEAEEKLGNRCKELVRKLLGNTDHDIYNKMNKIMLEITEKLSPDIQTFVFNLISEGKVMKDKEAIDPLFDYLTRNLQMFGSHLFPAVFEIILHHMWQVSVDSVDKCLEEAPLKKGTNSAQLHQRLFTTLKTMRDFYHCGGDGLDDEILDSDCYKTLYSKLDILRLPTDKLILRFFSNLVQRQCEVIESGKAELGTLLISIGYLKQSSVVEVDVIQGKSLPGLDKSGLSDPFVQLTLVPPWIFTESSGKHFKTDVQKQTLDPFFNETFKLPATQAEMDVEETVLLLSVFDHDIVGANDFAGMCVVSCKDLPQLVSPEASLTDPDAPQRKNLTLPLFRYTSETPAFVELDARARLGDDKATSFFKVNKKLLGHLSRLRHQLSTKSITVK